MKRLLHNLTLLLAASSLLLAPGCAKEDLSAPATEGEETVVSFQLSIDNGLETRAISDGTTVNSLIVAVYEDGIELEALRDAIKWPLETNEIDIRLIKDREYQVLFWLQYVGENNESAYTIGKDGVVTINYETPLEDGATYLNGGFSKMEHLDAFYAVQTIKPSELSSESVSLTRPVAQLNIADPDNVNKEKEAKVSLKDVATKFNALTGKTVESPESKEERTFTFMGSPAEDEKLTTGTASYNYIATIYLFPTTIQATYQIEGLGDKNIGYIPLKANTRSNILGTFVATASEWNGNDTNEPAVDTAAEVYVVDDASELAWIASKTPTDWNEKARKGFRLTNDLDMAENALASIALPDGATVDGNGKTIKNLKLGGAVFSDAMNLTVTNLTIENVSIDATATDVTHVGVLVNTLKGSSTFSNVTVKGASVKTSNGAAGGIVGYIVRQGGDVLKEKETLNVTFNNCIVESTSVTGTMGEGHFVGLLRGYDNGEVLTFNNCEAKTPAKDVNSYYINANKAEFVEDDLSSYDGFLGTEGCFRGIVNYGSTRFIPKWDGVHNKYDTSSKSFENEIPLLNDEKYENGTTYKPIYSAFDLARLQNASIGSIRLLNDVDMGGIPQDGVNIFEPISSLSYLYGDNKSISNLYIKTSFDDQNWYGGAFVRMCRGGAFEKVTICNAHVEVSHIDGNGYASILLATAEGNMTMSDIHVKGGYLYGVNKMGGIIGYVSGSNLEANNCSVSNLEIVSDKTQHTDTNPIFAIFGIKTNGEIGGMFGFITSNAEIDGCSVNNVSLDCIGTNNGQVGLGLFSKKQNYAGRHVNVFIGDIRTTNGQAIRIRYNTADFFNNNYLNRKDEYSQCDKIGHVYYTDISYLGQNIKDIKGTVEVSVDGNAYKSLTVPNGY